MKHPMQKIAPDDKGVVRFVKNQIVADLLNWVSDERGLNLNTIARGNYDIDDREQFYQLIGYSVGGCPLREETREAARWVAEGKDEAAARIEALEGMLAAAREGVRMAADAIGGIDE